MSSVLSHSRMQNYIICQNYYNFLYLHCQILKV